jgi:hypothetical protein
MTLTWQLVDDRGQVLAAVEDVGDMAVEDRSGDVLRWYGELQAAVRGALGPVPA